MDIENLMLAREELTEAVRHMQRAQSLLVAPDMWNVEEINGIEQRITATTDTCYRLKQKVTFALAAEAKKQP